jgi:hypothetical protein
MRAVLEWQENIAAGILNILTSKLRIQKINQPDFYAIPTNSLINSAFNLSHDSAA